MPWVTIANVKGPKGDKGDVGEDWFKGGLAGTANINTIADGLYRVTSSLTASQLGLPVAAGGEFTSITYNSWGIQTYITVDESSPTVWTRRQTSSGWQSWQQLADLWRKGGLLPTTDIRNIADGDYNVSTSVVAEGVGFPVFRPGTFKQVSYGTTGVQTYVTADSSPRTFQRRRTSAGWALTWSEVSTGFRGGMQKTLSDWTDLDTAPTGSYSISTPTAADDMGLPDSRPGIVQVWRYGSAEYGLQIFITLDSPTKWYTRYKTTGGWSAWTSPMAGSGGGGETTVVTTNATPGSGMKLVPCAITLGQGTTLAPTSRQFRIPFKFNAPINRWRLHITDRNPHNGEHVGAGINIGNVYLGNHASNGSFTGTPTRIGGFIPLSNLPDGEWVSAWRTEPLGNNVEKILSYDYTSTSAPFYAVGGAYNTSNMNSAAVQFLNGDSEPLNKAAFDIWFEVETYATTPVIAAFGDSLSSGAGATLPCHESALSVLARRERALPVHFAVSGNAMQDWANDTKSYKWTRWEHLGRADVVLWGMGHNDVYRGRSFTQMRADFDTCYPLIISRVAPVVVGATVTTRNEPSNPAMHDVRKQWNTWMLEQANSPMADGRVRDVFDFAAAINNGDLLKPEYDSGDQLHLNTAGYIAEVATINHRVTTPPVMYAT